MKAKDLMILAGAAVAVVALLKYSGIGTTPETQYWAVKQGNTGYPDAARTGGGVWV